MARVRVSLQHVYASLTFCALNRLKFAGHQAFQTIVPEVKDRIPLNRSTAIYPILCYAPFVFLAYLTRRPDTYHIRLLLLPSTVTLILVAAYRFRWTTPELNVYNWGQCGFVVNLLCFLV